MLSVCRTSTHYQRLPQKSRTDSDAPFSHGNPGDDKINQPTDASVPCVELASKCGFVFTPEASAAINKALRGPDSG